MASDKSKSKGSSRSSDKPKISSPRRTDKTPRQRRNVQVVRREKLKSGLMNTAGNALIRENYQKHVNRADKQKYHTDNPRTLGIKKHTHVEKNVSHLYAQPEVYAKKFGPGKSIITKRKGAGSIGADYIVTWSGGKYKPGDILPHRDVRKVLDAKFGKNKTISSKRKQKFINVFGKKPEVVSPQRGAKKK